jgi:Thioredoxin
MLFNKSLLLIVVAAAGLLTSATTSKIELVSYCTSWSGECKNLAAELQKIRTSKQSLLEKHNITIREVDADKEPNTILAQKITRYPTLRLQTAQFDSTYQYSNEYTSDAIFNFLSRSVINSVTKSSDWQADVKKLSSKGYSIYLFRGPVEADNSKSSFSIFKTASSILSNAMHTIYLYQEDSSLEKPSLELFTLSEEKITFTKPWTLKNVLSFASVLTKQSVVSCLSIDDMSPVFDKEYTGVIMFVDSHLTGDLLDGFKAIAKASKKYHKKIFAICDVTQQEVKEMYLSYFGFTKFPVVGILEHYNHDLLKYQLNGATAEELKNQWESYDNKNLPLFYKSEDVPATNKGFVTTLVGSNFEATIKSPSVHFMVLVTASDNCKKCSEAETVFSGFAEKYQKDSRIRFGKIDLTHNDIPSLSNPDLPSVLLYLKDTDRTPVHLLKKPSEKALAALLTKHTNIPA